MSVPAALESPAAPDGLDHGWDRADRAAKDAAPASARSLRGVDWLNFFLADVQTGVGPFLAIYLAGYQWNEQRVGLAMTVGGIAGIVTQTPVGGLVDRLRSKRAIIAAAGFTTLLLLMPETKDRRAGEGRPPGLPGTPVASFGESGSTGAG